MRTPDKPGQSKTGWSTASEVLKRWKASTEYDTLPKSDMLFDKHTKNTDETFIKTLIVFQKSLLHSIADVLNYSVGWIIR